MNQVAATASAATARANAPAASAGVLQRKCACGGQAGFEGECEDCAKTALQRKARRPRLEGSRAPEIVHEVLRSSGSPLDPATLQASSRDMAHDFGRVRIHTDAKAAASADVVEALAYTVGDHVVFAAGQFAPDTRDGRALLAHELTHVKQQSAAARGASPQDLTLAPADSSAEREAEHMERHPAGPPARTSPQPVGIARQPKPAGQEAPPNAGASTTDAPSETGGPTAAAAGPQMPECKGQAVKQWIPDPKNRKAKLPGLTELSGGGGTQPDFKVGPAPAGKGVVVLPTGASLPPIQMKFLAAGHYLDLDRINYRPSEDPAHKKPGGYRHAWKVTQDGSAKLAEAEQEHCNDFRIAFYVSLFRFAEVVNDMAKQGTVYADEKAARTALAAQVKIDPANLPAYFQCLADSTRDERDNNHWHTPTLKVSEVTYVSELSEELAILPLTAASLPHVGKHSSWDLIMQAAASPTCLSLTTLGGSAAAQGTKSVSGKAQRGDAVHGRARPDAAAAPSLADAEKNGRLLQRKCTCGRSAGAQETCEECQGKSLQRSAVAGSSDIGHRAPPIVQSVLRAPGQPMDAAARAFMEPRFAQSFGDVRIHADAQAAASTRALHALAYTVGRDIVFDSGRYDPTSSDGRRLLAHELAHVVQQTGGGTAAPNSSDTIAVSARHASEETEAEAAASQVMAAVPPRGPALAFGAGSHAAGPSIMRQAVVPAADGPGPYDACPDAAGVAKARDEAATLVAHALDVLGQPKAAAPLLERHFHLDINDPSSAGDLNAVRGQFARMATAIGSGIRILCRGAPRVGASAARPTMPVHEPCAHARAESPSCAAGDPGATVIVCEQALVDLGTDQFVKTILHEFAHIACNGDPPIRPQDIERYYDGKRLPGAGRNDLTCADSYAWFALQAREVAVEKPAAAEKAGAKASDDGESFGTKFYRFLTNIPILGLLVKAIFGGSTAEKDLLEYLSGITRQNAIENAIDSDDKAREIVLRWKAADAKFRLAPRQKVLLVQEMLSGSTGGDDQDRILDLLELSESDDLGKMFGPDNLGVEPLENKLEGDRRERLEAFFATRFKGGRAALLSGVVEAQGDAQSTRKAEEAYLGSGPVAAARQIRKAVEGPGTDEAAIYAALKPFARDTLRVQRAYQELYDEDLRDRLEDEMSGAELEQALALLETPYERYLHEASDWLKRFPAIGFGLPWNQDGWFDDRFWGRYYDSGRKEWMLILTKGLPHQAIDALFHDQGRWHVDCAVFVDVVQLYALRQSLGAKRFDQRIGSGMALRAHGSTGIKRKLLYKRDAPTAAFTVSGGGQLPAVENAEEVLASAPVGSRVRWTSQLLFDKANNLIGPEVWTIDQQAWPNYQHENTIKLGPDEYGAQGIAGSGHVTRAAIESELAKITAEVIPDASSAKVRAGIFISEIEVFEQPEPSQQIAPGSANPEQGARP